MIAKILTRLNQFRDAMRSPAAQVALAGTLLTIGVRIVESVLSDAVTDIDTGKALRVDHARHADELGARVTNLEHVLSQLTIDDAGGVYVPARRAAAQKQPADAGDEPDHEGWPVGRSAQVPVSAVRLEEAELDEAA